MALFDESGQDDNVFLASLSKVQLLLNYQILVLYNVFNKKVAVAYIFGGNTGKSWWILITSTYLERRMNTIHLFVTINMKFVFHTTLDAAVNRPSPKVHHKSVKCDILFQQGSVSRYFGEVDMFRIAVQKF